VVIKLAITVVVTVVLLIHMQPITNIAIAVSGPDWSLGALQTTSSELVVESATALVALLVATALSTYKPQGRTQLGQRKLLARPASEPAQVVE